MKVKPNRWVGHGLKPWIQAAKKRLHHNMLAIALANKLAHRVERSGSGSCLRGKQASSRVSIRESSRYLSAEVCERTRRDGGSVFPAISGVVRIAALRHVDTPSSKA